MIFDVYAPYMPMYSINANKRRVTEIAVIVLSVICCCWVSGATENALVSILNSVKVPSVYAYFNSIRFWITNLLGELKLFT